jgi:single-strand DNA-binding protein
MSSVNKALLLGYMGKDPEIRTSQDGTVVANFSLATTSYGKDKKQYTEWHRVVAFNKAAEVIQKYCKSGSQVFIEGSLSTEKWTDKQGVERYTTKIIVGRLVLLGKNEKPKDSAEDYARASGGSFDALKDDFPF